MPTGEFLTQPWQSGTLTAFVSTAPMTSCLLEQGILFSFRVQIVEAGQRLPRSGDALRGEPM